jgi:hypothetical protein
METIAPPVMIQTAIARAVQKAIAHISKSDGYGYCYLYGHAGCTLARAILGRDYRLQAGELNLMARPPDGWLALRPTQNGLQEGAYHCWFGRIEEDEGSAEVVDLAARHYYRWANSNQSLAPGATAPIRWAWPAESPEYVWMTGTDIPSWIRLIPDPALTERYARGVADRRGEFTALHRLA